MMALETTSSLPEPFELSWFCWGGARASRVLLEEGAAMLRRARDPTQSAELCLSYEQVATSYQARLPTPAVTLPSTNIKRPPQTRRRPKDASTRKAQSRNPTLTCVLFCHSDRMVSAAKENIIIIGLLEIIRGGIMFCRHSRYSTNTGRSGASVHPIESYTSSQLSLGIACPPKINYHSESIRSQIIFLSEKRRSRQQYRRSGRRVEIFPLPISAIR